MISAKVPVCVCFSLHKSEESGRRFRFKAAGDFGSKRHLISGYSAPWIGLGTAAGRQVIASYRRSFCEERDHAQTEDGDAADQGSTSAQGARAERCGGGAGCQGGALDGEGISRPGRGGRSELGGGGGVERGGTRSPSVRDRRSPRSGSPDAGLGGSRERAARSRRDAEPAVARVSGPSPGGLSLHPVLQSLSRVATALPAADDAPGAPCRRDARGR